MKQKRILLSFQLVFLTMLFLAVQLPGLGVELIAYHVDVKSVGRMPSESSLPRIMCQHLWLPPPSGLERLLNFTAGLRLGATPSQLFRPHPPASPKCWTPFPFLGQVLEVKRLFSILELHPRVHRPQSLALLSGQRDHKTKSPGVL